MLLYVFVYICGCEGERERERERGREKEREKERENLHNLGWLDIQPGPGIMMNKAFFQAWNPTQLTTLDSLYLSSAFPL